MKGGARLSTESRVTRKLGDQARPGHWPLVAQHSQHVIFFSLLKLFPVCLSLLLIPAAPSSVPSHRELWGGCIEGASSIADIYTLMPPGLAEMHLLFVY